MAPAAPVERRFFNEQGGTVTLAILVSLGAAVIVALLVIVILVVLRRRKKDNDIPFGVPSPLRTHKSTLSEQSLNPLLKGEWDRSEKLAFPTRQLTDEVVQEDRDTLSNNPHGLYRVPSTHTIDPATPVPSSYCLPEGLDMHTVSDHYALYAPVNEYPPPRLPPLIIPDSPRQLLARNLDDKESSPTQPLSHSSSSSSLYSQPTAETAHNRPGYFEIPLSQEFAYNPSHAGSEDSLQGGDVQMVGTLLKARAQRNPNGLVREPSQVSHIERHGSIRSVAPIHQSNRPYSKRYRSKKRRATTEVDEMEALKEVSEAGSLRSPRQSPTVAYREPSLLVQVPPRAAVSNFPQLLRAH